MSRYQKGKNQAGKTNLDLLEQEIVSGSGIRWAICKSAPHPRQPRQHPTSVITGPHRLHELHRYSLLLQMLHIEWSVCVSVCVFGTWVSCENSQFLRPISTLRKTESV